jgi:ABC-type glycerol-3-phosphate transport system substrate-binding protein
MSLRDEQALVNGFLEGKVTRRQFIQRAAAAGVSLSSIGAVLAACGGGGGDTAVQPPAASGPTTAPGAPTEPPPPTAVVADIGQGDTQIKFWHGLGGADGATMATMLKRYSDEKKVGVRSETYAWDVFYQKLPTSIVGRTPPDMGVMHADRVAQFKTQGLVQRADALFFDPGLVPKDDFGEDVLAAVTVDGEIQAVPFDQHGWGMYVNTELLDKAGLDYKKMPKNGDEFIEWGTKLTTDKNGKHPDEDGFNPNQVQVWGTHVIGGTLTLFSTIWSYGGDLFDPEKKKAMLDSENTVRAVQYTYDAIHKHRIAPTPTAELSAQDLYAANRLAMMYDGTWALNFFKDRPPIEKKTKAVWVPSLSDGKQVAWYGSHLLIIPNQVSEDRTKPAVELIKWLSDNSMEWATSGQIPARLSAQNDPRINDIWSVAVFSKMFQEIGRTLPSHPALSELTAAWDPAFSAALSKTTPVKEALTNGNKQMQAVLDRA